MSRIALPAIGLIVFATFSYAENSDETNPYSGQETREIKALAAADIDGYLAGKGMGLAKAAELNGYPGPAHVLKLADALGLSSEQKQQTEALFKAMETKAKVIGHSLVDEERKLDHLFASRSITSETLTLSLQRIGVLQAMVRQAHLESHLAQLEILAPEQVALYMKLRGYAGAENNHEHGGHRH